MSTEPNRLTQTVEALRPTVPAIDFDTCTRFYVDLGFRPRALDVRQRSCGGSRRRA